MFPSNPSTYSSSTAALVRERTAQIAALIDQIEAHLAAHGGPLLFGGFSIADAYFAPVVMRFRTYGVSLPAPVAAYVARVAALPGVAAWVAEALVEHDFVDIDEPYRKRAAR